MSEFTTTYMTWQ